jgi:EAL domain-containing protein (putative c-di-GMP-specific phosphodiesterase class I)
MDPRQPTSFGDVAREVVRAEGGGRFSWHGFSLSTAFQPLYSVERGAAFGDEALVRLQASNGKAASARGVFGSLDREDLVYLDWTSRALHLRNYAVFDSGERRLFLNVHPAALAADPDGGRDFTELVRFYGLTPERIVLELLETGGPGDDQLAAAVATHRRYGFSIAVDHFGEGSSNFDRVAALRPKLVKLDPAVLRHALGGTEGRRMLPQLVELLKAAGAEVALKGVQNARDALAAIEAGAAYLQGHHLGAPARAPADETLSRELIHSARRLALA